MQPNIQMTDEEIEIRFSHHTLDTIKIFLYEKIRTAAKEYALYINELVPESREKALAFTKIEESIMWANSAIARRSKNIICPMCNKETVQTPVATNSSGTQSFCLTCGREEA